MKKTRQNKNLAARMERMRGDRDRSLAGVADLDLTVLDLAALPAAEGHRGRGDDDADGQRDAGHQRGERDIRPRRHELRHAAEPLRRSGVFNLAANVVVNVVIWANQVVIHAALVAGEAGAAPAGFWRMD